MIIKYFDINVPKINITKKDEWEQHWGGYQVMTKCISQQKRTRDAEKDRATRAEGKITEVDFKRDIFLSVLADIKKKQVNLFELGAGWGRICLELAGVIDYKVIPIIPVSYHCLAIEGEPTHYQWIEEHFKTQNINGIPVFGAVSDKSGTCRFSVSPDPETYYGQDINFPISTRRKIPSIRYLFDLITNRNIKIPMYTVDQLIKKYEFDHVDIIHMDVQGAEYKVMLGAAESIKNDLIDYLFICTHYRKLNDALRQLLSPKFDLILDIYPNSVATVEGFPPAKCHDGCQIYKRKNI